MANEGREEREYERARLMRTMEDLGFPEEFGEVLVSQLGGPWSLRRMTGYLLSARPTRFEPIADELIVILEERARIVDKLRTEEANAGWNEFLNRPDVCNY